MRRQGGEFILFTVAGKVIGKDFKVTQYGPDQIVEDEETGELKVKPAPRGIRMESHVEKYVKGIEAAAQVAAIQQSWMIPETDTPVRVDIIARIPVAKSWPKWKHDALIGEWCANKPDRDNIENCVFDGLVGSILKNPPPGSGAHTRSNPILRDDDQIAAGETGKVWCEIGEEGVDIIVSILPPRKHEEPEFPEW